VSNQEDLDALNGAYLGTFLFSGTNQYSAIQKSTGLLRNLTSPGTLNLNPDGSGSLNNSSLPFVTNGSVIFAIPSSGDPLIYVFTEGTLPN
jgi:hypothetical protein